MLLEEFVDICPHNHLFEHFWVGLIELPESHDHPTHEFRSSPRITVRNGVDDTLLVDG